MKVILFDVPTTTLHLQHIAFSLHIAHISAG